MVAPVAYTRLNPYTDWSANNPGDPHPGQNLDEDFDQLAAFSSNLLAHLALLERDDGKLADGAIDGDDCFDPAYLASLRISIASIAASGIQGPIGPQGIPGPAGAQGPQGPPLAWILGDGSPSQNIGVQSQLFLNISNGDVYQKGPQGWLVLGNIRGPAGLGGGGGVSDHGALLGLTDPDHPISAIVGLQEALDALQTAIAASGVAQKNVYSQPNAPTANLNAGDLWFDSDAGDRLYRWNGVAWIDVADKRLDTALVNAAAAIQAAAGAQATADGKVTTFYGSSNPVSPRLGDLWIRTDQGNRLYRYTGSAWGVIQDAGIAQAIQAAADAQSTADGKIESFYQPNAPIGAALGDLWIDTDDRNHPYRFNGSQWVSIRDAEIAQAAALAASAVTTASQALTDVQTISDGVVEVFYQGTAPVSPAPSTGDLWINTALGNQLHRFNGSSWVAIQDAAIQSALTSASLAQATADGKLRAYYQTTAPTSGMATGDLWYDTDDVNRPYRYNGSAWVDISWITGVTGGLITGVSIANGAVTAAKIAAGTITAASGVIANAAITNAMIQDGAITTAKIGSLQVDTANIKDGAINTAKLGTVSITNAQIATAAITNAKIADLTVGTEKLGPQTVTQTASSRATASTTATAATVVHSCSLTSTGGRLYIFWGARARAGSDSPIPVPGSVTLRLKRGATVLMTYTESDPDGKVTVPPAMMLFDETLPAGSYTYDIEVESPTGATVTVRQVLIMELKK